jgi:hypothetical protein
MPGRNINRVLRSYLGYSSVAIRPPIYYAASRAKSSLAIHIYTFYTSAQPAKLDVGIRLSWTKM